MRMSAIAEMKSKSTFQSAIRLPIQNRGLGNFINHWCKKFHPKKLRRPAVADPTAASISVDLLWVVDGGKIVFIQDTMAEITGLGNDESVAGRLESQGCPL